MTIGFVMNLLRGSILQILLMAAPVLIVAMLIGLLISIFQATTSIQDQTLTFVPKIVGILLTLILAGALGVRSMMNYTEQLIRLIPQLSG